VYQIKWNSTTIIAVSEAPESITSSEVISRHSAPNTCVTLCPYLEENDCCLQPTSDWNWKDKFLTLSSALEFRRHPKQTVDADDKYIKKNVKHDILTVPSRNSNMYSTCSSFMRLNFSYQCYQPAEFWRRILNRVLHIVISRQSHMNSISRLQNCAHL
jgi:hypothetical protein